MTTVKITSPAGKTAGALALPAEVFDAQANIPLMHQVVTAQLAAARQGTHSTKTRGDVSGGGKKPYKQKGTGRARQGSTRAPQFTGGGISHGPVPHGYAQRTPKKMKVAALRGALSDRAREGRVHVLSAVVDGDVPSTKAAVATLAALGAERNLLVVVDREDETGWKSLRNVPSVHLLAADQLNTYDVLCSDHVIFTRAALDEFLVVHRAPAATEADVAEVDVTEADGATAGVGDDSSADSVTAVTAVTGDSVAADAEAGSVADDESAPAAYAPAARDFGPGSHAPLSDGSQPDGFPIKGNADSMLYHVPGSSHYARTVAEVWFDTAESAQAAGFQLPPSQRKVADEAAADEAAADEAAADEAATDEEESK